MNRFDRFIRENYLVKISRLQKENEALFCFDFGDIDFCLYRRKVKVSRGYDNKNPKSTQHTYTTTEISKQSD
ncbi:MAG: hypothetical protein OXC03_02525 [Flavobacteriaceae bacterium]|nr:hypothetical protein [Flavobacteriaceae bacterium]